MTSRPAITWPGVLLRATPRRHDDIGVPPDHELEECGRECRLSHPGLVAHLMDEPLRESHGVLCHRVVAAEDH